jgi:hypothetical protein
MSIPLKLREQLNNDPFMVNCIHETFKHAAFECDGRIEFHHNFIYRKRQQQLKPFILPLCECHHDNLDKRFIELIMLIRWHELSIDQKWEHVNIIYPRYDFVGRYNILSNIYKDRMDGFLETMEQFK